MPDYIHVRDKATGHQYPVLAHLFDPAAHTKTGKPALGPSGEPVGIKPKTTVAKEAAKEADADGQKTKEND